ncbi:hypothetical protein NPIL_483331 [Nephila pilipes]|uniref:Uncharacterized protein n=1 Tax=Nephila pilipes TaxID=299642 RepID=A0A8X6NQI6_NEPPI|nr:hypothetical protein NPIL_483331 [Nephila pilipes]
MQNFFIGSFVRILQNNGAQIFGVTFASPSQCRTTTVTALNYENYDITANLHALLFRCSVLAAFLPWVRKPSLPLRKCYVTEEVSLDFRKLTLAVQSRCCWNVRRVYEIRSEAVWGMLLGQGCKWFAERDAKA